MNAHSRKATIYRMVMPDHICPFGLKSLDLLKREGFSVDDNWLKTREETDSFKSEHEVETTPQTFIDGQRIERISPYSGWEIASRLPMFIRLRGSDSLSL